MQSVERVHLLERLSAHERSFQQQTNELASQASDPLGRVITVSGSQVTAQFISTSPNGDIDVTVGSLVGVRNGESLAVGTLSDISLEAVQSHENGTSAVGHIDLLGEIFTDESGKKRFQNGIRAYPKIGNAVVPVRDEDLEIIYGLSHPHSVQIGVLQQNAAVAATVNVDEMVRKHFAIVGSTGSGKSSGTALVLRKAMEVRPDLRVLLIDAHNEYSECFEDRAVLLGPDSLKLPFWLFNFDEIAQIIFGARGRSDHESALLAELIPVAKAEYARTRQTVRSSLKLSGQSDAGRFTVDTPAPYLFEEVIALAENRMGKLENGDLAVSYQRLLLRINAARKNPRYAFIFDDGAEPSDTMIDVLCEVLRVKDDERPMAIVQLAAFPSEIMEVIVSVLFRMAFEFGLWSNALSPVLVVCEEAHNYANADRSIGFGPAREGLSRIAKEGRKYGVFLGLVTQRPHLLDPTLVSQCSTVFAMRLGHEDDQKIVRAAVSDAAGRLLAFLPSLGTREALVIGAGVPTVTRLRFAELPANCIPRSHAVWGREPNAAEKIDDQLIGSIVGRWRGAAPTSKPVVTSPPLAESKREVAETMMWSAPSYRE
jgi:DNA helicase HerA-like ATPase